MTGGPIECRLPRLMRSGAPVVVVEERLDTGEKRAAVAVVEDRNLDGKYPYEGGVLICLDGTPTYGNDDYVNDGSWHYVDVYVTAQGSVATHEVRWPDDEQARRFATLTEVVERTLDWDFDDGDGVESIRIHYSPEVDYVVPLRSIPDERETQRG